MRPSQTRKKKPTNKPHIKPKKPSKPKKPRKGNDIIADFFGGALGNAVKAKRKRKEQLEKARKK